MRIIVFKPTHRCNLDCPFCYDRSKKASDKSTMPVDKAIYEQKKAMDTSINPEDVVLLAVTTLSRDPSDLFSYNLPSKANLLFESDIICYLTFFYTLLIRYHLAI